MRLPTLKRFFGSLALAALFAAGCTRGEYRRAADQEAQCLVEQKSNDPRWGLPDFTVDIDPRSRYFDPYDPDKEPMPPDDPASHRFMHCVDGMKGWKGWHRNGDIPDLENPNWRESLDAELSKDSEGRYKLPLDKAIVLAVQQSPDFQEQLETLYLSALDVSTERFRFDVQFFGGTFNEFTHLGSETPGGESNTITSTNNIELRKRFATAGELLVGFANTTVWEFFGPDKGVTTSILNFSLVQPLLRAGGRVVALEQLTIAERGLLANLRAFARYRTGFYTDVAIGELGVGQPQRRGGFFGGTGLTGFSGQGSGGFGGVGEATGFGSARFGATGGTATGGGAGFAGGGAGQVGGYIGLLQQLQQISNTEESLRLQLRTLALLEANLDAGLIDIAQVDQYRQNIETERANLLQARNAYQSSLDEFCRDKLGLPPDLPIVPDTSLIKQFQFIDPGLSSLQNELATGVDQFGKLPLDPPEERLVVEFESIERLRADMAVQFDAVPKDLAELEKRAPQRELTMTESERSLFKRDRMRLADGFQSLATRFEKTAAQLQSLKEGLKPENRRQTADKIVALLTEMSNIINELSLVQARARLEMITIDPVKMNPVAALDIARANRLDWMNNRAALVDTWRLIEFNANALKSDFTIRFSGDLRTLPGESPVAFRDETGSLRASFEFDPPLTRLIERNNYRQQLIEYQQDRRQLIQFGDQVNQTLRLILRDIDRLAITLEIQRRAVAIAIRRVDQTRETLNAPVPAAMPGQPPQALGPTSAQNLLFALSDLRNTQNNLMSVWLNYYAVRMRLYRELGVMRLDERGVWIEESLEMSIRQTEAECPLPPALPEGWVDETSPHEEKATPNSPGPTLLPVPPTPAPASDAPKSAAPQTPVPQRPAPFNPAPFNPAPVNPAPMNPAPMNPAPMNPVPETNVSPLPAPPAEAESPPKEASRDDDPHVAQERVEDVSSASGEEFLMPIENGPMLQPPGESPKAPAPPKKSSGTWKNTSEPKPLSPAQQSESKPAPAPKAAPADSSTREAAEENLRGTGPARGLGRFLYRLPPQ